MLAEVLAPECRALLRRAFRELLFGWYLDTAAEGEPATPEVTADEVIAYLDELLSDEKILLYREL